jgi:predicted subunit of tRNA(5-methylaminomethyl-2-thiouridylate) methyltransferase
MQEVADVIRPLPGPHLRQLAGRRGGLHQLLELDRNEIDLDSEILEVGFDSTTAEECPGSDVIVVEGNAHVLLARLAGKHTAPGGNRRDRVPAAGMMYSQRPAASRMKSRSRRA